MVSVLAYSKTEQDIVALRAVARELIATISEDDWEIRQISTVEGLREYLAGNPLIHLVIYDISDKASLDLLLELRKAYQQARIMILADISISPMEYIKPGLKASSLLLKPWTREQAYEVLRDFFEEYLAFSERGKDGTESFYVVETKEGTFNIPFEQIYFFEAREKKVYVCIGKEEFGFYTTLDKLKESLPEYFIRCHRSFIVNTKKIRKIMLSQNIVYLSEGFDVPLSRSYRATLKGMISNGTE